MHTASPDTAQNLLVIFTHDIGQHIGAYGVDTVSTPQLDAFAREGLLFENMFCTSPSCSPSRAACFTGRFPHANGVFGLCHGNFMWKLHDDEKHLAAILRDNGFETCLTGIWHETLKPGGVNDMGYQYTLCDDGAGNDVATTELMKNEAEGNHTAPVIGRRASHYLREKAKSGNRFFLYAGFFEPHRDFGHGGATPDRSKGVHVPPYIPQETEAQRQAAESEFAELQGAIKVFDTAVGQILTTLKETGLDKNTLVVFTADHGIAMPRAKCTLYDPGIEVPLIVRGPGVSGGGRRCGELVSNVDVTPTLLDYFGIPRGERMQGRSMLPLLQDLPGATGNAEIYAEKTYHAVYDPMRCVRTAKWKYIVNFECGPLYDAPTDIRKGAIYRTSIEQYGGHRPWEELYDLENDPWERNNLAAQHAGTAQELRGRLLAWMRDTDDPLLDGPVVSRYYRKAMNELLDPDGLRHETVMAG